MIAIVYDVMGFLLKLHACLIGKTMNEGVSYDLLCAFIIV